MPKEFHRSQRLGEQLRRLLSEALGRELDDPALGLVSLTEVRVSRDIGRAVVFFSLLKSEYTPEEATAHLQSAAGYLRSLLGRQLKIRAVPELEFRYDESLERGQAMTALIDKARAADARGGDATDDE